MMVDSAFVFDSQQAEGGREDIEQAGQLKGDGKRCNQSYNIFRQTV